MTDVDPSDAFGALSDPVRVGILEALAERRREQPRDPGLRFAELRKSVGVRDSGRFRYHLEKLRDVFVDQDDEGTYRLNYAGMEVATAIVAGTYTQRERLGPTEIDSECTTCGSGVWATYEDGVLGVRCREDHRLFTWSLPPNAAEERSIEDLIETATLMMYQTVELLIDGTCPECYSPVTTGAERVDDDSNPYRIRARCDDCGSIVDGPVGVALVATPELESLYHRHDRSIRRGYWWEKAFAGRGTEVERIETDPLRLRVSVTVEDEVLTAEVDETGRVTGTESDRS